MSNKFGSFLKVAGETLANGASSYFGLPPVFKVSLPAAGSGIVTQAAEIQALVAAAIQVEAIGKSTGMTSAQKITALEPLIFGILQNGLALGDDAIGDPTLCQTGAQEIAQGIVDFTNGLKPGAIKTNGISIVPPPVPPQAQAA